MSTEPAADTVSPSPAFALPEAMTIATAEALAAELCRLPADGRLTLDASKTENITTPGIQLLLALHRTCAANGGRLSISEPKEALVQAFHAAGLESQLNEWRSSNG